MERDFRSILILYSKLDCSLVGHLRTKRDVVNRVDNDIRDLIADVAHHLDSVAQQTPDFFKQFAHDCKELNTFCDELFSLLEGVSEIEESLLECLAGVENVVIPGMPIDGGEAFNRLGKSKNKNISDLDFLIRNSSFLLDDMDRTLEEKPTKIKKGMRLEFYFLKELAVNQVSKIEEKRLELNKNKEKYLPIKKQGAQEHNQVLKIINDNIKSEQLGAKVLPTLVGLMKK